MMGSHCGDGTIAVMPRIMTFMLKQSALSSGLFVVSQASRHDTASSPKLLNYAAIENCLHLQKDVTRAWARWLSRLF